MTIKAIIWDLGGVLLRTEDPAPRQALAVKTGMSSRELEYLFYAGESGDRCQLGEISYEEHVENVRQVLGLSAEEMTQFVDQFWGGDIFDRELVAYIRDLKSRYRTGLLSNAFSNLRPFLEQDNRVDGVFDDMVISAEVGIVKPDPAIYLLSLSNLGVQPGEAVFIDDMPNNVQGAISLGMHAVRFESPAQVRNDLDALLNADG